MTRTASTRSRNPGLKLVLALVVIVVLFVAVGFLSGWFGYATSDGQSQITIDQEEMQQDIGQAAEASEEAVNRMAETVQSATEDEPTEP